MFKYFVTAAIAVCASTAAFAVQIPDGTASISFRRVPTVSIGATTATFSLPARSGGNADIIGTTGSFPEELGNYVGTLTFSKAAGTVLAAPIDNFFSWEGYSFDVTSAQTIFFNDTASSGTFTLYLLGVLQLAGFDDTAASMTISANRTGASAYSGSATLSIPPAEIPAVPEPAAWAMMLVGFAGIGSALRKNRRTTISFG